MLAAKLTAGVIKELFQTLMKLMVHRSYVGQFVCVLEEPGCPWFLC